MFILVLVKEFSVGFRDSSFSPDWYLQVDWFAFVRNKTAGPSTISLYQVTAKKLDLRIRGIPENRLNFPDERVHFIIETVEEILEFLKIKDKRLAKIYRIGKYDAEKEGSRMVVIHM